MVAALPLAEPLAFRAVAAAPTASPRPGVPSILSFRDSGTETVPGCDLTNKVRPTEAYQFACGGGADIWMGHLVDDSGHVTEVAVKVLRAVPPERPITFLRESSLWSAAHHPNVAPFLGVSFDFHRQGTPCLVLPYFRKGDITKYIKEHPGADKLALLAQAASGLAYLHKIGIIHGDFKGSNILVNDDDQASVADFGLARTLQKTGLTTQLSPGTPRFMAPELVNLKEEENEFGTRVTKESDVWAFAMTVIEILSESKPFPRIKDDIIVPIIVAKGGRPERQHYSQINNGIWKMLELCWDKNPSSRPEMKALSGFFASQAVSETAQLS